METLEKEICYSYPTSINAAECGYKDTGCYAVETLKVRGERIWRGKPTGFSTLAEAKVYADSLAYPYSRYSL